LFGYFPVDSYIWYVESFVDRTMGFQFRNQ